MSELTEAALKDVLFRMWDKGGQPERMIISGWEFDLVRRLIEPRTVSLRSTLRRLAPVTKRKKRR